MGSHPALRVSIHGRPRQYKCTVWTNPLTPLHPWKRHLRGMEPRPFMTRLMMIILRVELLGIVGVTGIILAPSRMVPFMPMEVTNTNTILLKEVNPRVVMQ